MLRARMHLEETRCEFPSFQREQGGGCALADLLQRRHRRQANQGSGCSRRRGTLQWHASPDPPGVESLRAVRARAHTSNTHRTPADMLAHISNLHNKFVRTICPQDVLYYSHAEDQSARTERERDTHIHTYYTNMYTDTFSL